MWMSRDTANLIQKVLIRKPISHQYSPTNLAALDRVPQDILAVDITKPSNI